MVGNEYNMFSIEKTSSKNKTYLILKIIRDSEHGKDDFIPQWLKVSNEITEDPRFFSMNFSNYEYNEEDIEVRRLSVEFTKDNEIAKWLLFFLFDHFL